MSDIKIFKTTASHVTELSGSSITLEKSLQHLIEKHLETFLGVKFLKSEFITSTSGRIDTLGIDENNCPVIIEYKRTINENVINQGLFYLDWLMDHRRDFEWLVLEKFGKEYATLVNWDEPRLICIAGDFTKYDSYAVKQIDRNIELIRYKKFGDDLLLFEVLTSVSASSTNINSKNSHSEFLGENQGMSELEIKQKYKTVTQYLADADQEVTDLYETIKLFLLSLGDDVQMKILDHYIAFRRLKNFVCVEIKPQIRHIKLFLRLDPSKVELIDGFSRNVKNIGHYGTGDLELVIKKASDFDRAKDLILRSYDEA